MYRPDLFRVDDVPQMHALMRARPFAALVSNGAGGLYASHFPTVLKDAGAYGVVEFHLARANPHWKELAGENEALIIFHGPEGYITPNWYPSKAQRQSRPNLELRGRSRLRPARNNQRCNVAAAARDRTHRTAGKRSAETLGAVGRAQHFIDAMVRGIVGFRFAIARLEGKWKMNQNREMQDRAGVVKGLGARGRADDLEMADFVSRSVTKSE